jgi:FkbM family methyltransferase
MMGFNGYIFSFEPIREECALVSRLAEGDSRWVVFDVALGSENGTKPFHVIKRAVDDWRDSTVFSSFLPLKQDTTVDRIDRVEVKRLDSILRELLEPLENPRVFLKVDTQGYDVEVIRGAEGCIGVVMGLQSEVSVTPLYEGMPHYLEALGYYEALGFSLMDLIAVGRAKHGSVLEYDCLMARLDQLK